MNNLSRECYTRKKLKRKEKKFYLSFFKYAIPWNDDEQNRIETDGFDLSLSPRSMNSRKISYKF